MKKLSIDQAVEELKKGNLVVIPTETVYGIACDSLNAEAIEKLYKIKERPKTKPTILQISDMSMLSDIAQEVPVDALKIMERYWPGPVTVIVKRKEAVSDVLSGETETIGIRIPNNRFTLELIKKLGRPIAVPSANVAGQPSPISVQMVEEGLKGKDIAGLIDGGDTDFGVESTIVKCVVDDIEIVREGVIPEKDIRDLIG